MQSIVISKHDITELLENVENGAYGNDEIQQELEAILKRAQEFHMEPTDRVQMRISPDGIRVYFDGRLMFHHPADSIDEAEKLAATIRVGPITTMPPLPNKLHREALMISWWGGWSLCWLDEVRQQSIPYGYKEEYASTN